MKTLLSKLLLVLIIPGIVTPNFVPKEIGIEKLPISIDNQASHYGYIYDDINKTKFFKVVPENQAFKQLIINSYTTHSKTLKLGVEFLIYLVSYLFGNWVGSSDVFESDYEICTGEWLYETCEIDYNAYNSAKARAGFILGLSFTAFMIYMNMSVTGGETGLTETITYYNTEVSISNHLDNQIFKYKLNINERINWENIFLSVLTNSDKNIKKLLELVNEYNQIDFISELHFDYLKRLEELGEPKSEFETTYDYEKRLKHEKNRRFEIIADNEQKKRELLEKEISFKFDKISEIDELLSDIRIYREFDYELLEYNADFQNYTFSVYDTNLGKHIQKNLQIDIAQAKDFKENIADYAICKIYEPKIFSDNEFYDLDINDKVRVRDFQKYRGLNQDGLFGTETKTNFNSILNDKNNNHSISKILWIEKYEDYILVNRHNKEIIYWSNQLPLIADRLIAEPPNLKVEVNFYEPSGEGYLDVEEDAYLNLVMSNKGLGESLSNRISISQISGPKLFYDVSKTIDVIKPNSQEILNFKIKSSINTEGGEARFRVFFIESQGFEPDPIEVTIDVRPALLPQIKLIDYSINDQSGNGKIELGEQFDITVRLQNIGEGVARNSDFFIQSDISNNLYLAQWSDKNLSLENLYPGDFKDITFSMITNKRTDKICSIKFELISNNNNYKEKFDIDIELEKAIKNTELISFKGIDENNEIRIKNDFRIDIENNIPKTAIKNSEAVAVIIGNRDYQSKIPIVEFAVRDAEFVREYLIRTLGYRKGNILMYQNASLSNIKVAFNKLKNIVKKGKSDVFVYYSGHGAPATDSNQGYFVPVDADPNYIQETGYAVNDLYTLLNGLDSKSTTVVIDACFSGSSDQGMILKDLSPVFIEVDNAVLRGNNTAVFTSATGEQVSSWYRDKKHSLFTYYFLKSIQGDGDSNKDKKLTFSEIKSYIDDNVPYMARKLNNREQTPQLECIDKERVLVRY